jgi:hypothetical protein
MSRELEPKDPSETLDYAIEWSAVLAADGGLSVSTSTWSASDPAGLTLATPTITGTKTIIWASGGVANTDYKVSNTMVTSAPARTHQRTIIIPCRDL